MREYELTYLVSDEVLEKDLKKITDRVVGIISDVGGKVSKEEAWGRRKLTYPIKKQNFATYVSVWFELPKEKIVDIEHEFRVHPQIIRHLIVVKVAKGEKLAVTKEDIVGTEDVKKVLGEKSFEIVEGETEASKDLMAVRETPVEDKEEKETKDDEKIETESVREKKSELIEKLKKATKPKIEKPVEEPQVKADQPIAEEKEKEDEADRIKKLDEKLDELLKDDL